MQCTRTIREWSTRSCGLMAAVFFTCLADAPSSFAQGCVTARGAGMTCGLAGAPRIGETLPPSSGFQGTVAYRYFKSDRHFRGDHEESYRQREGSEVINRSHFVDFSISYAFNPRYSLSLTVPYVAHTRSQTVRDDDRTILNRYETQSFGMGDLRLVGDGWVLDPVEPRRGNILLGLGVDLPTGEDEARDTFQSYDSNSGKIVAVEKTVDQSIQPGDGGWGIILDLYAYYSILPNVNGFVNGSYTLTPEEKSGVPTFRSREPEAIMSIADSYFARAGFECLVWPRYGMTLSLAGRADGVPAYDLVGGSEGFRRPGYAVAVEPGVSAAIDAWTFNAYFPVAVYRNRVQSVPDKEVTRMTGVKRVGDAAFADYVFICSVSRRF